jgi:hypothetical protein
MSRIRSLHPAQWTDEQFVTCTPLARLLAIGLRNEADDHGVFEWKPLTIKMRLLPGDNCDVSVLLEELIATEQITRYTAEGKQFGIIRNFMAFQRPKKPVYRYPVPPEFPTGTEPVSPKAELDPQMEEEGGREEKTPLIPPGGFERFWDLYPHKVEEEAAREAFAEAVAVDPIDAICAGVARYRTGKPKTQSWKKPAGWLRAKRWRDQWGASTTPAPKTSTASVCTYDEMVAKRRRAAGQEPPIISDDLKPIGQLAETVRMPIEGVIS